MGGWRGREDHSPHSMIDSLLDPLLDLLVGGYIRESIGESIRACGGGHPSLSNHPIRKSSRESVIECGGWLSLPLQPSS